MFEYNPFDSAMEFVFLVEGGLSDHAADKGGLTKYGVSQKAYPNLDIKNLTKEQAKDIVYRKIWDSVNADAFQPEVSIALMDFAVNSGNKTAGKALQNTINILTGHSLVVDGILGKKSVGLSKLIHARTLASAYIGYRHEFFLRIVKNNPSQNVFLKGWLRRLAKLNMFLAGASIKDIQKILP